MNHGTDTQAVSHGNAQVLAALIASYRQDMALFERRAHFLHKHLRRLVRRCCRHLRSGDQVMAQTVLRTGLNWLFGVEVQEPLQRPLAMLASLIRRVLVDYYRLRAVPDDLVDGLISKPGMDLVSIDIALQQLHAVHPAGVSLLEQRYFARLGVPDIALEWQVPVAEIESRLRFAKAWLEASLRRG